MSRRPAAGGGHWVEVVPERLERWLNGFQDRHGPATLRRDSTMTTFRAVDGSVAECHAPFPPLPAGGESLVALLDHACAERRVGVVLLRRGGFAVGVFDGPRLVTSKAGTRYVQGATAAGGWSQQRFARRREGQARDLVRAAADVVVRLLVNEPPALPGPGIGHVVTGGDRPLIAQLLADPRLQSVAGSVVDRFLDVPDPRRDVLERTPSAFRAVRIRVVEP